MEFNKKKFHHLKHSLGKETMNISYTTSDGTTIEPVHKVKDLGTIMTPNLSFEPDIDEKTQKARQKMGWALRSFSSRDKLTLTTLYKSFVQPHLEYNSILTQPCLKADIAKLERVQKALTAKIYNVKSLNYWERLNTLRIYSLERRRDRFTIIYTWRIINNLAPNLPINPITSYTDGRRGHLCYIPKASPLAPPKAQKMRENSFAVKGPKLYNLLPSHLRNSSFDTIDAFKRQLDKFLSSIPDEPIIDDYKGRNAENSNSLLVMIPVQNRGKAKFCY